MAYRFIYREGSLLAISARWGGYALALAVTFAGLLGITALLRQALAPQAAPVPTEPAGRSGGGAASLPDAERYGGRPMPETEADAIIAAVERLLERSEDLSVDAVGPRRLAEAIDIPYHRLSCAVNERRGVTVAELVKHARVRRAERLLLEREDASILDIAYEAGFSAKSSFNDAFKAIAGESPKDYRRRMMTGDSNL